MNSIHIVLPKVLLISIAKNVLTNCTGLTKCGAHCSLPYCGRERGGIP